MYVDIAALVRGALLESGCDENLLGNFDGHSTISLDFDNQPSLMISLEENNVWLWSRLCEENTTILHHTASSLLEKIMQNCNFSITGQVQLTVNDGYYELRGIVSPDYLQNGASFAEALDEFFILQEDYLRILK